MPRMVRLTRIEASGDTVGPFALNVGLIEMVYPLPKDGKVVGTNIFSGTNEFPYIVSESFEEVLHLIDLATPEARLCDHGYIHATCGSCNGR